MLSSRRKNAGFSLIEMAISVAVVSVLAAMSVPRLLSSYNALQLKTAATAVKSAIQVARYQAIMHGYPYQLALSTSTTSYQLASEPTGTSSFSNLGSAVPFTGLKRVAVGQATTLQFSPNGSIQATTGSMSVTVTYSNYTETIGVSANGDVTVSP